MISHKFRMMDEVADTVTGFKGKVVAIILYATGCIHYGIAPKVDKDGKMPDWQYLDETRLKLVRKGEWSVPAQTTSGPYPNPPQS